ADYVGRQRFRLPTPSIERRCPEGVGRPAADRTTPSAQNAGGLVPVVRAAPALQSDPSESAEARSPAWVTQGPAAVRIPWSAGFEGRRPAAVRIPWSAGFEGRRPAAVRRP